jgi:hypothetical protein
MLMKLFHVHTCVAIAFGLVLLWQPEFIPFAEGNQGAVHVSKLYGIALFIFGVMCYLIGKEVRDVEVFRKIYLSIIALYMMSGLYFVALYRGGTLPNPLVGSTCLIYAGLVVIAYMNEIVGKRQ